MRLCSERRQGKELQKLLDNHRVKCIDVGCHLCQRHGSGSLLLLSIDTVHCDFEECVVAWQRELTHSVIVRCHRSEHLCCCLTHSCVRITKFCFQMPASMSRRLMSIISLHSTICSGPTDYAHHGPHEQKQDRESYEHIRVIRLLLLKTASAFGQMVLVRAPSRRRHSLLAYGLLCSPGLQITGTTNPTMSASTYFCMQSIRCCQGRAHYTRTRANRRAFNSRQQTYIAYLPEIFRAALLLQCSACLCRSAC